MRQAFLLASAAILPRSDTLHAARDVRGASSTQNNTVAAAWSAVAVS
jgi:hypothetical protein